VKSLILHGIPLLLSLFHSSSHISHHNHQDHHHDFITVIISLHIEIEASRVFDRGTSSYLELEKCTARKTHELYMYVYSSFVFLDSMILYVDLGS